MPPEIVVAPVTTIAEFSAMVSLTCNATGQPAPDYTWFRLRGDNKEVVANETGPSLTFEAVQPSDRGVYSCSASNDLDTVNSSNALLSIRGKL